MGQGGVAWVCEGLSGLMVSQALATPTTPGTRENRDLEHSMLDGSVTKDKWGSWFPIRSANGAEWVGHPGLWWVCEGLVGVRGFAVTPRRARNYGLLKKSILWLELG